MDIQELLNNAKDKLGLVPQETEAGVYIPSAGSLKIAAPNKTNYDHSKYDTPYTGNKKIMMICTEEQIMTIDNGKKFNTGNHPVEMMVPLLHFKQAGFDVDVFTPTGDAVKVEEWAMPEDDDDVKQIYNEYKSKLDSPNSIAGFVANDMNDDDASEDYAAVFIPGGHGAMLGLPEDKNLGKLLRWAHDKDLFTLAICHGPAALLSADIDSSDDFIYKGYTIVAFPTAMDKQMPKIGYLPGDLTWYFGDKLEDLGVTIDNHLAIGNTHQDRKLITGDGPLAANDFGKLAANELLRALN